jgi:hypothetical protein
VYFIGFFIQSQTSRPIPCTKKKNNLLAIRKAHRQNPIAAFAKAEKSLFKFCAMSEILGEDAPRIVKRTCMAI